MPCDLKDGECVEVQGLWNDVSRRGKLYCKQGNPCGEKISLNYYKGLNMNRLTGNDNFSEEAPQRLGGRRYKRKTRKTRKTRKSKKSNKRKTRNRR